jgi:hypothetical protein
MKLKSIILTIPLIIIYGCSEVSREKALGKYIAKYPYGKETLVLMADSTYEQTFIFLKDTIIKTNRGRWQLHKSEITFRNFIRIDNGFGKISDEFNQRGISNDFDQVEKGIGTLNIRSFFWQISININPDEDFAYKKIN